MARGAIRIMPRQRRVPYPARMSWMIALRDLAVTLYRRSRLTWRGLVALLAAVATVTGAGVVLAGVYEDVVAHNGAATEDPHLLQSIADHRPAWLVHLAKLVTTLGSVGVVAILAAAVGAILWWRGAKLVY